MARRRAATPIARGAQAKPKNGPVYVLSTAPGAANFGKAARDAKCSPAGRAWYLRKAKEIMGVEK